jgi:hypothetical protein
MDQGEEDYKMREVAQEELRGGEEEKEFSTEPQIDLLSTQLSTQVEIRKEWQ